MDEQSPRCCPLPAAKRRRRGISRWKAWFKLTGLCLLLASAHLMAQSTGAVTYVYTDPQGTPLAEANANGVITATFDYAPYGKQALGSPPNGPGYTGHVNDPDTGLVYMQARYYDPTTGRFLSTDPLGPAAGNVYNFNRYAYASNNPIVNMDPDGRDTVGENIDENAQASADSGNKVATFAWAFAGAAWNLLGAESVSQVADKGTGAGAGNMVMAGISIVTLGKGEEAATIGKDAFQGVKAVAKDIEKTAADTQGPRFATGELRQQVMDKGRQADGSVHCAYCGKPTATQSDHVVPYSKGGPTKIENLEPSCGSCNASKGSKDLGTQWTPPKERDEQ